MNQDTTQSDSKAMVKGNPVATHDTPRARERKPPRRAIDGVTISEVARLCAKLLTEAEACRKLGLNHAVWRNWKCRAKNSAKFSELLEAYRANRIDDLISRIESSAEGVGMKQPDWRAAAYLLQITDRRFNPSAPVEDAKPSPYNAQIFLQVAAKIYGEPAPAPALPPSRVAGELPEPDK